MPDHASPTLAPPDGDGDPRTPGRPYGPVGLVLSTLAILLASVVLCALAGALALGIASAALGWEEVARRLTTAFGGGLGALEKGGLVLSLALYAAFSLAVLGAARWRGGTVGWRALVAWRPWHPLRGAGRVWVTFAVTMAYSLAANIALEWLYPASKAWVQVPEGRLWAGLFVVLAVVAAPVTEELFFRGWLYTGLRSRFGAATTIAVTAVLFALAHWERTHLYALAVLPVGVALGLVRERTRSIAATMAFHAGYNGFASVLLLFGQ